MNHFIAGILKIAILEGSIALLIVDLVAGERFVAARNRAHAVLTTLMVLAFCNYGALHPSNDPAMVLTAVPLILLAGHLLSFAFDPLREQRFAAFREACASNPRRTEWLARFSIALAVTVLFVWLNTVPGGLWGVILGAAAVLLGARTVRRVALGELKVPESLTAWVLKRARVLAVAMAVVLSTGWVAVGVGTGRAYLVHQWEQFHFYLGAKYQGEVGWFNLYKAVIIADRESINTLAALQTTRDLSTFETVSVDKALENAAEVKGRFSPERWESFKADWVTMSRLWPIDWTRIINDHGNSNSPAWSVFAAPLTRLVPLTLAGQALLGWLDILLMFGLWLVVWQTFGHRVASTGLLMWAGLPIIFEYSTGSILRWDWLFCVGLAACCLKQKRYGWAGGLLGFAVATKLFPLFFGVALGLKAALEWRRTRKVLPEHVRFVVATVASGLLTVGVSTAMFGVSAWKEYAQRIQVAQLEKFYGIQYSFKSVYLQHAAGGPREWAQAIFPSALKQQATEVEVCKGSSSSSSDSGCMVSLTGCGDGRSFEMTCTGDDCVCTGFGKEERFTEPQACGRRAQLFRERCHFPEDFSFNLLVAQLMFSVLIMVLLRRADDVEAFLLGPLLVFTWLTVNMYYWNMLGLLMVGLISRSERPNQKPVLGLAIGLHLIFMVYYLYQHLNRQLTEGYAVAWMMAVLIGLTALWEFGAIRRGEITGGSSS